MVNMSPQTTWVITNFLALLVLPPLNMILLGGLGYFMLKRKPRFGKALIAISLVGLYLLCTPIVGNALMAVLEKDIQPLRLEDALRAQAIVILAGGSYPNAVEYGRDAPSSLTLERVEYGAFLHRETGLPILVTGGSPESIKPEAETMLRTLQDEFGVPVKWVETQSMDTRQNALNSAAMLAPKRVKRVLVVSHAWHLPRAKIAFAQAGLEMIPAPTRFGHNLQKESGYALFSFLPQPRALTKSAYALHEMIGILWYRLRS